MTNTLEWLVIGLAVLVFGMAAFYLAFILAVFLGLLIIVLVMLALIGCVVVFVYVIDWTTRFWLWLRR